MTTDIDWQQELDASFGRGDDLPAGHYVAAGHRAVRRRRRTGVVAALATAAVVAGIAWGVAPGRGPARSEAPIATEPSRTATARAMFPWFEGDAPARLGGSGGVEIREGAVVHERRDGLYPGKETESAALDLSYEGERWWVRLEWDAGGGAMSSEQPDDGLHDSFDAFVAAAEAGGGMILRPTNQEQDQGFYDDLVTWSGGDPQPRQGVDVLRTVEDPVSSSDDSIGLVLSDRGEITWMLITLSPSGSSASYEKADQSGWTSFGQWLSEQVALEEGKPGLRLVTLDGEGTVSSAQPSVEVLDQQSDPDLSGYGTDVATASAVALVDWHGERWFVLMVRFPDEDAVTTFAAEKAGGAETIDQFIAFAADRADEGGLR